MKKILILFLSFCLMFCFAIAEEVDDYYQPITDENDYRYGQTMFDKEGNREIGRRRAREIADEIEAEYGIEILFFEECDEVGIGEPLSFRHELSWSSAVNSSFAFDYTPEKMMLLKETLSLYPKDMFKPFQDQGGNLRFLMTGMIRDAENDDHPSGVTDYRDGWYNICLSVSLLSDDTIHHELWHAFEYRLYESDPEVTSTWFWPLPYEDFVYGESYDFRDNEIDPDMVLPSENAWFVWKYSTVDVWEDEATVYELMFDPECTPEWWAAHPHLQEKRDALLEKLYTVFPPLE